jgi:tetraacyldisaccharide 4'-kinase
VSRPWLAPLAALYGAAVAAKNLAYEREWLGAEQLSWPVASVGNLSVGGAGKTPLTIRLAELLKAEGIAVDVLSRGYGRSSRSVEQVDPDGDAGRFGDEPLLIARRAGVPVFVGASRHEAGLFAEERERRFHERRPSAHLLDDGFQHRRLARAAEIVIVHRSDFAERLLPAGRLREPLAALRRADFVVLRDQDGEFEARLRQIGCAAPVWWMRRSLELPPELATARRPLAFCGIARPEEFFAALASAGCSPVEAISFGDHHRYAGADMERLIRVASDRRADAFVTTEKDAVRLGDGLRQLLVRAAPLRVAPLRVSLRDEGEVVRQLLLKLRLPSAR